MKKQIDSDAGSSDEENKNTEESEHPFPHESFNMVAQADWEDAIIWDSQDPKVKKLAKSKTAAGWVPSGSNRSAQNVAKSHDGILSASLGPLKMGTPSNLFLSGGTGGQTASRGAKASKGYTLI